MHRLVGGLAIAALLTIGLSSRADELCCEPMPDPSESGMSVLDRIAAAAAIAENESEDVDAPHDLWCWTKPGERDRALADIALVEAAEGSAATALAAAELIDNDNVRAETLANALTPPTSDMPAGDVSRLLEVAESAAMRMADESCTDMTWSRLAQAQGATGQVAKALQSISSIEDDQLRFLTEHWVGNAQIGMGNYDFAEDVTALAAKVMLLSEVALIHIENGDEQAGGAATDRARQAAQALLPAMLDAGPTMGMTDGVMRLLPFYSLMKAQARLGDVVGVRQSADDLRDVMLESQGYAADEEAESDDDSTQELLSEAYAWAGDEENAVATANEMERSDQRAELLKRIADIMDDRDSQRP